MEAARRERPNSRKIAAADLQEQLDYKAARRADNLEKLLNATVESYANGLELFTAWSSRGVPSWAEAQAATRSEKSEAAKLQYLRNEIEMRVIGLGWLQFETRWSSSSDESVGTVEYLLLLLKDILTYEVAERRAKRLPTEAAPPVLRIRTFKELGTPSLDAQEIAGRVSHSGIPPLHAPPPLLFLFTAHSH